MCNVCSFGSWYSFVVVIFFSSFLFRYSNKYKRYIFPYIFLYNIYWMRALCSCLRVFYRFFFLLRFLLFFLSVSSSNTNIFATSAYQSFDFIFFFFSLLIRHSLHRYLSSVFYQECIEHITAQYREVHIHKQDLIVN